MRLPSPGKTGAITAGWALVLPAVVAVLSVGVGALSLQVERAALDRLSADAARMVSLGADSQRVHTELTSRARGEIAVVVREGPTPISQCVRLHYDATLPALPGVVFPLESEACALKVPSAHE